MSFLNYKYCRNVYNSPESCVTLPLIFYQKTRMGITQKKVLIIQQLIPHYRIPIFNELSNGCKLTVAAQDFEDKDKYKFETKSISLTEKGPFTKINDFAALDLDQYDSVIFLFNIRFLNLIKLLWKKKRKFKLILWGIGVSSENGYDNNPRFDKVRYWAARQADEVIFYSKDPIEKYVDLGNVKRGKLHVANNTLDLIPKIFDDPKEYFLFVGTLKKYKRIDRLIEIYNQAYINDPNLPDLHIIGDGEYMAPLKDQITAFDLNKKVILHGAINDPAVLETYYKKAIASISPYQAGLSVLQSLSMGVPFICNHDAVTGGERFNIIDGYNGYLMKGESDFSDLLLSLGRDKSKIVEMNKNAHKYFKENCTVKNMVDGFLNAINS